VTVTIGDSVCEVGPDPVGVVHDADSGAPGGAQQWEHVTDEVGCLSLGAERGVGREVADEASPHLAREHRGVPRRDEVIEHDGHGRGG
jgi:hypothetical protein